MLSREKSGSVARMDGINGGIALAHDVEIQSDSCRR